MIDLGKDVEYQTVVDAAIKYNVRLVGLSALMTTALKSMEGTISLLRENNVDCKIVVGGAVLTPEYAEKIGADFYAKDAKETVDIAKKVYSAADAATDNISMAVASIGSLMWYASENKEYDEKAMRIDMGNIGLLLTMLGQFDISLRCTIENATDALNAIKKANTDSNRG